MPAITINGETRTVSSDTVDELLRECEIVPQGIAIEVNRVIIPRSTYAEHRLGDGDVIEIVQFVGGG